MTDSSGESRKARPPRALAVDIEELLDSRPDVMASLADKKSWLSQQVRVLEAIAQDSPEFAVKAYQYAEKVRGYHTIVGVGRAEWSVVLTAINDEDDEDDERQELSPSILDGRFVEELRRRAYAELIASTKLTSVDKVWAMRMDQRGTELLIDALLIEFLAKEYGRLRRRAEHWANLDVDKLVLDMEKLAKSIIEGLSE